MTAEDATLLGTLAVLYTGVILAAWKTRRLKTSTYEGLKGSVILAISGHEDQALAGIEQVLVQASELAVPLTDPSVEVEIFRPGVERYLQALRGKARVQNSFRLLLGCAKALPIALLVILLSAPVPSFVWVNLLSVPPRVFLGSVLLMAAGVLSSLLAFLGTHAFESRLADAIVTTDWGSDR